MNKNNKIIYSLLIIFFACGYFLNGTFSLAQEVNYVVISEIQIGGETANDEFIKLYNPTENNIDLADWDLKRKTKSGTESNILNNIEGVILAKGYFIIMPRANCGDGGDDSCYKGVEVFSDEYTTNSFLAKDNTILLYDSSGILIDKVGWGEAGDFEGEAININLEDGQSYLRKLNGENIQDTDHNQNDFVQSGIALESGMSDEQTDSGQPEPAQENETGETQEDIFIESGADSSQIEANNDEDISTSFEIVITEFLPDPEDSDRDNEFIEMYNRGSETVDIANLILEDKMGRTREFTIPEGTTINAKSYKVFYSDQTNIALNNSGDGVLLKDDQGNIISETPLSGSAREEQSYALDKNDNWSWTLKPTPRKENIIEIKEIKDSTSVLEIKKLDNQEKQETEIDGNGESNLKKDIIVEEVKKISAFDFSDGIVISEVYPNPIGNDNRQENYEWIEIYNNSDQEVNLKGWQIDDILNKGSRAYLIAEDVVIRARDFLVLNNSQTKIVLNNSGDEINILWPDGEVVDSLKYEKSKEGFSYNWVSDDSWEWSYISTPGKNNYVIENVVNGKVQGVQEEIEYNSDDNLDFVETDINKVKDLDKYSRVKISGIVSTPVGIFSDKSFYLSGSGIQVYSYEIISKKVNIGDKIELVGRLSEVGGESGILIDNDNDIVVLSHDNLLEPKLILTGDLKDGLVGFLVITEGKVVKSNKNLFYIDDGSGEAKIYIKPTTGIKDVALREDSWVTITGQVSKTSLGYRILPRFQNDIKIPKTSGTSTSRVTSSYGDNIMNRITIDVADRKSFWNILFFLIIALVLFDWGRMKTKK